MSLQPSPQNECSRCVVALFIPALDIGGAERQILELAKGLDKARWDVLILTNYINPFVRTDLFGLKIVIINKGCKLLYPLQLLATLYREKPSILCVYLVSAQAYALIVRIFVPGIKLVFSIRDAIDYSIYHGRRGRLIRLLLEKSTSFVHRYIFNSVAGRREKSFFPDGKSRVIPNGIDTHHFAPDQFARSYLAREANIDINGQFVGIVANFSIYKGYDVLIHAARKVVSLVPDVHFIAIGNHETALGREMKRLVNELHLASAFHFLGVRTDVNKLLPGIDVICSSSVTEGFSNAICEGRAAFPVSLLTLATLQSSLARPALWCHLPTPMPLLMASSRCCCCPKTIGAGWVMPPGRGS